MKQTRALDIPTLFSKSGLQGYKIFLDRYTLKAPKGELQVGDLVLVITKKDPKFPQKEIGWVEQVLNGKALVRLIDDTTVVEEFDLISKPLETHPNEVKSRVAKALASCEDFGREEEVCNAFEQILFNHFIPGGRILAGAGVDGLTLQNCFVLPSPKDSRAGFFETAKEMAETHARGGGVGINLSSLRPRYAHVKGVNGISSGAVSWGEIFSVCTGLIEQGGSRRGATMLMINDWHPDVLEFIEVKKTPGKFENANLSVCISDEFMQAVEENSKWELVFPDTSDPDYDEMWRGDLFAWRAAGKKINVYDTIYAREIWNRLIEAAWASAEPGLHFIEHSNRMSNSWYFAPLIATNPCGEQPLEEYGVCTLGALDLSSFVDSSQNMDWDNLKYVIKWAIRLLDNVIDINNYHLPQIDKNHKGNRRIGLGTMGLGEMLVRLGIRYGSEECIDFLDTLYGFICQIAYSTSSDLAEEKGVFPEFDAMLYLKSGFMQDMPEWIRDKIESQGMRNVCVLTQAPTGTTGTMMGTSTGIEPYFSWQYTRTSRLGVHVETVPVLDDLGLNIAALPEYCVTAQELSPEEHIGVQAIIQRWTDSAIAKTTNAPSNYSIEETDKLYRFAHKMGCKGITIYRDKSRKEQVLNNVEVNASGCKIVYLEDGSIQSKCD